MSMSQPVEGRVRLFLLRSGSWDPWRWERGWGRNAPVAPEVIYYSLAWGCVNSLTATKASEVTGIAMATVSFHGGVHTGCRRCLRRINWSRSTG